MLITPSEFFVAMLTITVFAAIAQWAVRRRQMSRLRRLAADSRMHFSAADRFRLAPRIASLLPVPGAAGVRVLDLIYGVEQDRCRYIFTTNYTIGVLRTKTSVQRVVSYSEPRTSDGGAATSPLVMAPESLPIVEQYQHLLAACASRQKSMNR